MSWERVVPFLSLLKYSLALMEMKMVLAALALSFEIEFADAPRNPLDDIWSQIDPLRLKVEARNQKRN